MKYAGLLLASAALAAAHGIIDTAIIGGETYTFYQPYQDPYTNPLPDRVSRRIEGNGPVEDVNSIDLQCGGWSAGGIEGSEPAVLHATVAAGETVTLFWTLWPESHVGPSLTYMARCPDTGCQDWLPGDEEVWFKVQEEGRQGTSNVWGATSLMTEPNNGVQYTIPECLEPGFYLVRHELIALHAAFAYPGAQFYPGCHQLEVTGSGTTIPTGLVGFPGAYSPEDSGVTYDAYAATEYTIPGPPVFQCSGSNDTPGNGDEQPKSSANPVPSSVASSTDDTLPTSVPEPSFITLTAPFTSTEQPISTAVSESTSTAVTSVPVTTDPAKEDEEDGEEDECDADEDDDDCEAVDPDAPEDSDEDGEDIDECDEEGTDSPETPGDDDDECVIEDDEDEDDAEDGDDECDADDCEDECDADDGEDECVIEDGEDGEDDGEDECDADDGEDECNADDAEADE